MKNQVESILIVGGGSSGWMTAAALTRQCPHLEIALVESAVVPTIGVGESTIGHINEYLHLISLKDEDWMKEIELKYFSVLHPVRAFLDDLKQSANASITNVNSLLALQPEPHMIATSSARAALLNLTHSLAHEFTQYCVRVNSILLGMVESAQWKRRYETRSDLNLSW